MFANLLILTFLVKVFTIMEVIYIRSFLYNGGTLTMVELVQYCERVVRPGQNVQKKESFFSR